MRMDTLLMVLGIAVVAAGTYYVLDTSITRSEPELAHVAPDQAPTVEYNAGSTDDGGGDQSP